MPAKKVAFQLAQQEAASSSPPAKKKGSKQNRQEVPLAADSSLLSFDAVLVAIEQKRLRLPNNVASVFVPVDLLRGSNSLDNQLQIRPVTKSHVEVLVKSIVSSGFFPSSNFLVRRHLVRVDQAERDRVSSKHGETFVTAEGVYYFDIFDGNHRFMAARELIAKGSLARSFEVGCVLYEEDTPISLCAEYANRINEIQHLAKAASYVDMLTFVDKHCTSRLLEYEASGEHKSITVAKKKAAAFRNYKKSLGSSLRLKLISTLRAATVVGVSSEEVAKMESKFSDTHVFALIRMAGLLGRKGLSLLNSLQNIDFLALQAARTEQLKWRGLTYKTWYPEINAGQSFGFPSTIRATVAMARVIERQAKELEAEPEEKKADVSREQSLDWMAFHVAFMSASLFAFGGVEQGQVVDGSFAFFRTAAGTEAKHLFFKDLAFIRRMQMEAAGEDSEGHQDSLERVFEVNLLCIFLICHTTAHTGAAVHSNGPAVRGEVSLQGDSHGAKKILTLRHA